MGNVYISRRSATPSRLMLTPSGLREGMPEIRSSRRHGRVNKQHDRVKKGHTGPKMTCCHLPPGLADNAADRDEAARGGLVRLQVVAGCAAKTLGV